MMNMKVVAYSAFDSVLIRLIGECAQDKFGMFHGAAAQFVHGQGKTFDNKVLRHTGRLQHVDIERVFALEQGEDDKVEKDVVIKLIKP